MGRLQNPGEKEGQTHGDRATQEDQIIKRSRRAKARRSPPRQGGHHLADQGAVARATEKNRVAGTRRPNSLAKDEGTSETVRA